MYKPQSEEIEKKYVLNLEEIELLELDELGPKKKPSKVEQVKKFDPLKEDFRL